MKRLSILIAALVVAALPTFGRAEAGLVERTFELSWNGNDMNLFIEAHGDTTIGKTGQTWGQGCVSMETTERAGETFCGPVSIDYDPAALSGQIGFVLTNEENNTLTGSFTFADPAGSYRTLDAGATWLTVRRDVTGDLVLDGHYGRHEIARVPAQISQSTYAG